MRILIFIPFLLCAISGFAQPVVYTTTNSPTETCGNASGGLGTSNLLSGDIINRWQEGTLAPGPEPRVFSPSRSFSASSPGYTVTAPATTAFRAMILPGGGGTEYPARAIEIKAYQVAVGGTLSGNASFYKTGSGSISVSGNVGTPQAPAGTTGTNPFYYTNLTASTTFQVTCRTASICSANTNQVNIVVYNEGVLSSSLSTAYEDQLVKLSISNMNGTLLRWEYSINNGTSWSQVPSGLSTPSTFGNYNHIIQASTKFRGVVDCAQFGQKYTNEVLVTMAEYSQLYPSVSINGGNYVREQQVIKAGVTSLSAVTALPIGQKRQVTTYQDGYGRAIQQNIQNASPLTKDIIDIAAYDRLGRQATQYLPYVSSTSDGSFRGAAVNDQSSFYANGTSDKVTDSPYPFSKSVYEKSPLERLVEQGGVGQEWQPGNGNSKIISYSSNGANEIRLFATSGTSNTFYGENELEKTEMTMRMRRKYRP